MNKNKAKSTPVLGKVKRLAKDLVKAMSPKPAKKPQTKPAPKAAAKPAKAAPKVETKHAAPKKGVAPVAPAKGAAAKAPAKAPEKKDAKGGKAAPVVAALLSKPGKGEKPAKAAKVLSAEQAEKMCRETGCENAATTKGYCRLDYIKNWKKIKRKEMILKEGKLNQYIEELVSKYPDKYIDVIRQDLSTEVNFTKVIHDLELDESIDDLDYDSDSIDSLIGSVSKSSDTGFDDDEF